MTKGLIRIFDFKIKNPMTLQIKDFYRFSHAVLASKRGGQMKKILIMVLAITTVLVFSVSGHADLYNRGTDSLGNQLIYDSDLNITWYDYTREPDYQDYHMGWAFALDIDFGGTHYTDWRLPACLSEDGSRLSTSSTCTNSEMSHLYYSELGNTAGELTSTGPFQNLIPLGYWSGTSYTDYSAWAWGFSFSNGAQGYMPVSIDDNAIAVRTGDVSVVPEPVSSVMFFLGGIMLAGRSYMRRKMKA